MEKIERAAVEQAIDAGIKAWDEVVGPRHREDPKHFGPTPPRAWFEEFIRRLTKTKARCPACGGIGEKDYDDLDGHTFECWVCDGSGKVDGQV